MTSRKLRVAVVGCGRVSRTAHYSAIKGCPDYDFRAVCDVDRARADEWGRKNNVRPYYSIDELLRGENLDLVSICVPNGLHVEVATKAAERGISLLVEKPLAMNTRDADALISLCEKKGVQLFTVMQNRFNATNQLLKRAVDKGRFGKLLTANVTMRWHRGMTYYSEDHGWRASQALAGGVFTNQAVHYIDTLQWLVNAPPTSAYAIMGTAVHPIEVETHGCGIVTFANDVIGSLNLSGLTYPDDREGSITLLGEAGTVKVGGKSMNKILEWDFAEPDHEDDETASNADYEPPTVYGFGHNEMYKRAARVLLSGESPDVVQVPDGREGRKAVEILEGLYTSDRERRIVNFPV